MSEDIYHFDNPLIERFLRWRNETDLGEHDYDQFDVIEGLQKLACSEKMSDEAFDFVMALLSAASTSHPRFKLTVEKPKDGASFKQIKAREAGHQAERMATEIDVAVADGEKQEAAIQCAMAEYSLSRREVFRRLQSTRASRATYRKYARENGEEEVLMVPPDGYKFTDDGRIVPTE